MRTGCRGRASTPTSRSRGRFFEVDCLWDAQRLIVELDGGRCTDRRAFEADRERDRLLVADGWRVDPRHLAPAPRRSGRRSPRDLRDARLTSGIGAAGTAYPLA